MHACVYGFSERTSLVLMYESMYQKVVYATASMFYTCMPQYCRYITVHVQKFCDRHDLSPQDGNEKARVYCMWVSVQMHTRGYK
jgi:hypothetical protein